ncbi:MAG: HEAT repeat domain-containing protein, partial [Candidatus Heimdallarchaeota archaeon]|nr:HEAT repeat domain-containing protein [Candidatus Heimdallarchaeota archaeon]
MSEFDRLESSDKYTRIRAADALGNVRTKAALRALLDAARNDPDKDVRKAALDSIEKLRDPEALKTLEKIASDDKDRGTRSKAKDVIKTIETSGRELPESEAFSESDADRSRRDARALEEHEA